MKKIYVLKIMTKIFMILSASPYLCLFIILFVGMIFVMGMYSLYKNKNIDELNKLIMSSKELRNQEDALINNRNRDWVGKINKNMEIGFSKYFTFKTKD